MVELKLPKELAAAPFYTSQTTITLEEEAVAKADIFEIPFMAEILWYNDKLESIPWYHPLKYIPIIQKEWENDKKVLNSLYEARNRKVARPLMIKHIAALMNALWWMNRLKVPAVNSEFLKEAAHELPKAPVNAGERLAFLIQTPDHYHSFVQLNELFVENKKQFAVVKIKEQRK
ncbi:YpoC family protein [Alteribacillus sp. JSM 102045]|uniref:YpoC family protein n=1 Tax=Alteribacillus sp. JSM 102045 TaxID=1562101 RepID=UPI0035BEBD98